MFVLKNNAGSNFGRLQFGGTTASFPSIKRATTQLAFRLADDSADAGITAGKLTTSGGRVLALAADTSTALTLTAANHYVTVNNAGAITVTLPAAASSTGQEYWIKNVGAGTATIDPNASEQIRDVTDASTLDLLTGQRAHIVCDGTRWEVF